MVWKLGQVRAVGARFKMDAVLLKYVMLVVKVLFSPWIHPTMEHITYFFIEKALCDLYTRVCIYVYFLNSFINIACDCYYIRLTFGIVS